MLGVDGRPFRTSPGTPRNATEPHGAVNWGITNRIRNFFGFLARPFGFLSVSPIRDGFVYSSYNSRAFCWALMAVPSERPYGPHGTPRNPQIGKLGNTARIRNLDGPCLALSVFYLRRPSAAVSFILVIISALGVGRWWAPLQNACRTPAERDGAVKMGNF